MEIVHWLGRRLRDVPLFSESDAVSRKVEENRFVLKSRKRTWVVEDNPTLDETLLPERSIVRAHMCVYDQKEAENRIPYRIVKGFDINSPGYHRSVHYGVTGKTEKQLTLKHDLIDLFVNRKQLGWKGKDSLYDVWLISKGECRPTFDLDLFTERYPNWREEQKPFNLETICFKKEPFVAQNIITDVIELSD